MIIHGCLFFFLKVLDKLRAHALLQPVSIIGDQGRSGHVTSNTQMDLILNTVSCSPLRVSLYF